jgi:transposase-like protein
METKRTVKPYPAELREHAVRMVREQAREHASEWAAMCSVAAKVGCTAETLRQWARQAERDRGERGGLTSDERARLKALERENRELRQGDRGRPPSWLSSRLTRSPSRRTKAGWSHPLLQHAGPQRL